MDHEETFDRFLSDMYPREMLRGDRIERLGGKPFDEFLLDADTAEFLGCENVGVLVENSRKLPWICQKLKFLDASPGRGKWITIMSTGTGHWAMHGLWRGQEGNAVIRFRDLPDYWSTNKLVFTTPEKLGKVLREVQNGGWLIGGIILVDLECMVHKARSNQWNRNDRPQHIVDFRASLTRMGWAPPLIVMTEKLARSINTEPMRSAYCLEAWWYVDGTSISFTARKKVEIEDW